MANVRIRNKRQKRFFSSFLSFKVTRNEKQLGTWCLLVLVSRVTLKFAFITFNFSVPSVAEWSKALESDASAGDEIPVRAPVRAATLCPYA